MDILKERHPVYIRLIHTLNPSPVLAIHVHVQFLKNLMSYQYAHTHIYNNTNNKKHNKFIYNRISVAVQVTLQ